MDSKTVDSKVRDESPNVIIIAGPNGSGKSTTAPLILQGALEVDEFVNADEIAKGLSVLKPESVAVEAGKIMLNRLKALALKRASFAFETTLSARSYAGGIQALISQGYQFRLIFFWLLSPELAKARVAQRVAEGGHHVPAEVIERRYQLGIENFFRLYQPLATQWRVYNNSETGPPELIANGNISSTQIINHQDWQIFSRGNHGK